MLVNTNAYEVKKVISEANRVGIVVVQAAGFSGLAASIALFKTLKNQGKFVDILCFEPLPEKLAMYLSSEEQSCIISPIGNRELQIHIDFDGTSLEKVKYSIDGTVCTLVLHPVAKDFKTENIRFSSIGLNYDLLISIGAKKLLDYGSLVENYAEDLKKLPSINIDNSEMNENFATLNVVDPEVPNLCQLLLLKLTEWGFVVGSEVAEVLLQGLTNTSPSN